MSYSQPRPPHHQYTRTPGPRTVTRRRARVRTAIQTPLFPQRQMTTSRQLERPQECAKGRALSHETHQHKVR